MMQRKADRAARPVVDREDTGISITIGRGDSQLLERGSGPAAGKRDANGACDHT